jgi:hypothetical protein
MKNLPSVDKEKSGDGPSYIVALGTRVSPTTRRTVICNEGDIDITILSSQVKSHWR